MQIIIAFAIVATMFAGVSAKVAAQKSPRERALERALERGTDQDWTDYCETIRGEAHAPYAKDCAEDGL